MSPEHIRYIRRETGVSIVINTALSLAFFALVFGLGRPVPVWGIGAYVFDFLPQGFMIGLMATLVPGALAGKARREGRIAPLDEPSRLPASLPLRAGAVGLACALGGAGLAGVALAAGGAASLPFAPALAVKLGFGAALAAVVTPLGLRAALAR